MTRLIIWLSLAALFLSGCSATKEDEVEMRVAALRYAFKAETAKWESAGKRWSDIGQWLFVVDCDLHAPEVIGALGDYPVVVDSAKINRDGGAFVDSVSGKSVAFWRLKRVTREGGTYVADVGCSTGELAGYGQLLRLKKIAGRWTVVSSTPTWVS